MVERRRASDSERKKPALDRGDNDDGFTRRTETTPRNIYADGRKSLVPPPASDYMFKAPRLSAEHEALLERLEELLAIDENELERTLKEQPESFYKVGKQVALLSSQRDAAKQFLKATSARVDAGIRRSQGSEEKKKSEREIEAIVLVSSEVVLAQEDLTRLELAVGQFEALRDAFLQRSYAAKDLVSLFLRSYYGDLMREDSGKLRDGIAERAKREMQKEREGRRERA